MIGLGPRAAHQRKMPLMQRAHCRHQRNAPPIFAQLRQRSSQHATRFDYLHPWLSTDKLEKLP